MAFNHEFKLNEDQVAEFLQNATEKDETAKTCTLWPRCLF